MASYIEVRVTYADARKIAIVADAASRQAGRQSLTATHHKVLELIGRKLASSLDSDGMEGLFAVRGEEETATRIRLEVSTLAAYLKTLDVIATQTPKPHVRNTCQSLFTRLTKDLDVDALGLHLEDYDTLKLKSGSVF